MQNLVDFVSPAASAFDEKDVVEEAVKCLDQFTDAFNARDVAGMDAQLGFPHWMLSGADRIEMSGPGQHPPGFFVELIAKGWNSTEYLDRIPLLASATKVHFSVRYARLDANGDVLSIHENLWIVILEKGRWKICLRSY